MARHERLRGRVMARRVFDEPKFYGDRGLSSAEPEVPRWNLTWASQIQTAAERAAHGKAGPATGFSINGLLDADERHAF
jgi:hypothetical protein